MTLKEYLFDKNLSVKEFANIVGYSRVHISCIISGRSNPSKRLRQIINHATLGRVYE